MVNFGKISRWFSRLVVPGGLLLFIAWGVWRAEPSQAVVAPYARYFCFGSLAAVALVGWFYNRGRILFTAGVIALTVWGLEELAPVGALPQMAAVFLLPLNIVLFAALEERGIVSFKGLLKVGLILGQGFGVVMLGEWEGGWLEAALRWGESADGWIRLPFAATFVFGLGALALLALWTLRRSRIEAGLFWVLVAAFISLNHLGQPEDLLAYAGAAGVILLAAVLEHGYEVAYLDELTGLAGRRAFNEQVRNLGTRYAIAMCDVDHFKRFNDTFGHDVGDQVLRMMASKLSRVGGSGRSFRYGGEEFAVVYPNTSLEDAQSHLNTLREQIAEGGFKLRAKDRPKEKPEDTPGEEPARESPTTVRITISIGLAARTEELATAQAVINAADDALYRAKRAGRNCLRTA